MNQIKIKQIYTYILFIWFSLSLFALKYGTVYVCTIFVLKIIKFVTKISQIFAAIQTFAPKKEDDTYIDLFCHIELLLWGKSQFSTLVIFNNSNRLWFGLYMDLCWSQWMTHKLLKNQACEILLLLFAPFGLLFHVHFFFKSFLQTLDFPISFMQLRTFCETSWMGVACSITNGCSLLLDLEASTTKLNFWFLCLMWTIFIYGSSYSSLLTYSIWVLTPLIKIMCLKSFFHSTKLEGDIIRIEGYINWYFFSSNHYQDLFPTNWN